VVTTPRRNDWSETGAFVAMGGIGLVSFGAAMAAFRRAQDQASGGDQVAMVGWVLALIALICVGVSGYNLFRTWTADRKAD
jgi:lysozyme